MPYISLFIETTGCTRLRKPVTMAKMQFYWAFLWRWGWILTFQSSIIRGKRPLCRNGSSAPLLHLTWTLLLWRFDVSIKIVHLVAVKRTLLRAAPNIRVIVEETGLFCRRRADLFHCVHPEWHQEVLFYVLSIRSISVVCSPRLCGLWTCFMGWQQWLLHNQGSGNNPPVLKSSFSLEMESFNSGTVCVCLCGGLNALCLPINKDSEGRVHIYKRLQTLC